MDKTSFNFVFFNLFFQSIIYIYIISWIPTLTALMWQTRSWQIYPTTAWWFHRFLLWQLIFHSYSESSYVAGQVLADLLPHWMAISQIPTLTAHIWFLFWELICGRPAVDRCTPHIEWQFHRFLLYQVIFDSYSECSYVADQALADLPPICNGNYRFLSESPYLADQVLADLPPTPIEWHFHRLLLWQIIFHSYSESSYVADQLLTDVPLT